MDTKRVDLIVIRSVQFLVLTFFTFAVFLYYGFVALVPMAIWLNMGAALASVFGVVLGYGLGMVAVIAALFYMAKIPGLVDAGLGVGIELGRLASSVVGRIGELAENAGKEEEATSPSVESEAKEHA